MKYFEEGQSVHIIEQDGIALADYAGYNENKSLHKISSKTGGRDYLYTKDELIFENYQKAKEKFKDKKFINQHFNNTQSYEIQE